MRPLRTEAADRTTLQRALQATPDMLARPSGMPGRSPWTYMVGLATDAADHPENTAQIACPRGMLTGAGLL